MSRTDKTVLRIGGWAAIIGGILLVVVNLSSPRPSSDELGDPAGYVGVAANSAGWELIQFGIVIALLILLAAFYAITKSIENPPAAPWARLALGAVLLATTLGVAGFAIRAELSRGADFLGAEALASASLVSEGLLVAWALTWLGLAPLLYGVAVTTSHTYPTWLGWLTILAGLVGLVAGLVNAFAGPIEVSAFVLFPVSSGLFTLIILYLGVLLLRLVSSTPNSRPH